MKLYFEPVDYDPFADEEVQTPEADTNQHLVFEPVDYDPFADEQAPEIDQQPTGVFGALKGGAKNTMRHLGTAFDVVTGDDAGVQASANAAIQNPNITPAQEDFRATLAQYGDPDGVWDAIKNVARAAWNEPKGAFHEVVSQSPNSGVILGSMGTGAAVGTMFGGPVGTLVGGIGGLFVGNTAIETGAIANEKAMEGEYDRGEAIKSGAIKGGVITGVDTVTLGLTKWLTGTAGRAATKAVESTLARHGVNIADDAAVKAALQNKAILKEASDAGKLAAEQASKGLKPAAGYAGSMAGEVVGEGVGEYLGSSLAPGVEADLTDAVLESLMSMPQSVAEVGIGKSLNLLDKKPDLDAGAGFDTEENLDQESDAFQGIQADTSHLPEMGENEYSGTIPFAEVMNEEELGWQEEIERQRAGAMLTSPEPVPDPIQSMYQENQAQIDRMSAPPSHAMNEGIDLLEKNVDEFRRLKSRETSVNALNNRQQAMGQEPIAHDTRRFNQALAGQPDEAAMPLPGDMPHFQRNMEDTGYHPFAGLGDMVQARGEILPEQETYVDDGIDVSVPEFKSQSEFDQETFQQGLSDNFGAQDMPAEGIINTKPIFEHEVESDKVNTDPTEKQKEAGNYKKDHIKIDGHNITIENPDGSTRKGKDKSGKEWESEIHGHYGYFKRTEGKDGDQVDVFIKPETETSPKVFVVDQIDPGTGKFDEHKVIMGVDSAEEAKALYMSNYEEGWQGFGEITEMDQSAFKEWLKDGNRTKKPLAVSPDNSVPVNNEEYKPGDHVSWKNKKGEILTGTLERKVKGNWRITKPDGKTALMPESKIEKGEADTSTRVYASFGFDTLRRFFQSRFLYGQGFRSITEARKVAKEHTGHEVKPGTVEAKTLDEAIEASAVRVAANIVAQGRTQNKTREQIFDELVDLQSLMPNLSVRTSTSVMNQAYSTPLPLAFVASELAGINKKTSIYEPSAGNGALLIGPGDTKNVIFANELNPDRAKNIRFAEVTTEDGTEHLPPQKVDVVIGNPPFGKVKDDNGKTKTWEINDQYTTNQIDHAMVFKALRAMKSNTQKGRAVFIVGSVKDRDLSTKGRQLLYRAKDKVRFYKTLYDEYNVVNHFSVAGKLYEKQGAGWPVDIIVIDGKGKSSLPLPGAVPPAYVSSIEELKEKLNGKDDRLDSPSGDGRSESDNGNLGGTGGNSNQGEAPGVSDDKGKKHDRPGGESGGSSRGPSTRFGRPGPDSRLDDGKGTGSRSNRPADEQPEISGVSGHDNAGDDATGTGKSKPGSTKDSGKRQGSGSEPLAGESSQPVADEFSPDSLLAEWDNQSKKIKAKEKAEEAKQHFSNAIDKFKQINKLLGERGSFSTEKADEAVYNEIKTLLQAALDDIIAAGKSAKDFVKLAIESLSPKARPYFERFVKEDMVVNRQPQEEKQPAKTRPKPKKKLKDSDTQVAYAPASESSAIGTLTPTNMALASKKALGKIKEIHGSVDEFVAKELDYTLEEIRGGDGEFGYFSGEQVDAIALAIHNISKGAGFVIGDQTGVGKGRVVAAMQRYAMKRGLTPIFVTEKPNLYTDMYRDFVDIGMADMADKILITNAGQKISLTEDGSKVIRTKSNHNALLNKIAKEGVLPGPYKTIFTTYDQLNITGSPRRAFISEMVRRRGMLIMDESHNAGGTEGNKATAKKIPRSVYFRSLVKDAHSVFYSSATYAKRPGVMDLYSKTDMRLAVDDVSRIGGAILQGGVPLQQAVASMLVEAGQYVRRERSFEGVEYNTKTVEIDKESAEIISEALAEIKIFSDDFAEPAIDAIADAQAAAGVGASGASAAADGKVNSVGFSAIMHNLISQMLLSMKTHGAVEEAIQAFKEGKKPVITVANTMGSFIKRYAEDNGLKPNDGIGLQFNDLIDSYLDKTREYTFTPPFGSKKDTVRGYISDDELGEVGLAEFKRIKDKIHDLNIGSLPISPVDYIIFKLKEAGIRCDEITGRTDRIEYRRAGTDRYTKRPATVKSVAGRTKTIYDFNTDKLDALILNKSGSTGLSLHALPKYAGHSPAKRHMIILQAEANIDTHMQMLGRVHRSGQVIAPEYTQLMGDIPSEKRPAAVLAAKMASLNANTTAAKDSDLTAKETVDFMNKYGNKVVAGLMADFPELHEKLGDPLATDSKSQSGFSEDNAAKKITGRVPLLPLEDQEQLYAMIESGYKEMIEQLNATGENDLEARTFDTDAQVIAKTTVFDQTGASADSPFTAAAVAEKVNMKKLGKSYTSKEVKDLLVEYTFDMKSAEAKKADKSLSDILSTAESKHEDQRSDALNRYMSYEIDTVDKISDENRADAMEIKLRAIREDWEYLHGITSPGSTIQVRAGNEYHKMTVLKAIQSGKPRNPLALGTWKVTLAVPDSMRRITVPFSFLNRMEPEYQGPSKTTFAGMLDQQELFRFDHATQTAREDRIIITGNLLAAYGRYQQGRIINFTTRNKGVRQGVLMPADFNLEKAESERPIFLNNAKDLFKVVKKGVSVKGTKGDIQIFPGYMDDWTDKFVAATTGEVSDIQISVPASKAGGSKYYLNKDLLRTVGKDFVKLKNRMIVTIKASRASKVFDVLVNKMDEPFQNKTGSDIVREALGVEGIKFSTSDDLLQALGQGVTLEDIQARFKGQDVFMSPDGSISIRLQNGIGLKIVNTNDMGKGNVQHAMRIGRMGKKGKLLGKYKNRTITLNKDLASDFVRDHELYHFLKDIGLITRKDGLVLVGAMKKLAGKNRLTFNISDSMEENEANTFAQLLKTREENRGTILGKVLQKIADFLDALWYIGRQSARKIARSVESGDVFGQNPSAIGKKQHGVLKSGTSTGISHTKFPHVGLRQTGEIEATGERIKGAGDIARMFYGLNDAAQEEVYLVTTDKTGRIVEVHKFSKGISDESAAQINQLSGHLLTSKEAATSYLVHNHPAGETFPSPEDQTVMADLQASLKLNGIKAKGVIVADGKYVEFDERDTELEQDLKPIKSKPVKIPVSERRVLSREEQKPAVISNGLKAMHRFDGERDGILLMDATAREVAFIPYRSHKGKTIREAAIEILTKASKHSAMFAVINAKTLTNTNRWKLYKHLARGLKTQGVTVMDVISYHPFSGITSASKDEKMPEVDTDGIRALDSDETLYMTSDDIIREKFGTDPTIGDRVSSLVDKAKSKDERALARDRFIKKTLDNLHFIKKRLGDESYKMHRMLTGIKSATFAMFLEHGPLSWEGNALTVKDRNKGVLPFLKSIGPDWQNLLYWTAAKRAEQLEKEGRENWLDKTARDAIFKKVGTHSKKGDTWASLNMKLQAINKNVLDIAEQAGLIDPEAREMWSSNFYIPFYRILEDEVSRAEFLSGPSRSKKHISSQIRQLKGGQAKIGDPLENVLKNWMHLIDAAARNKARTKAFDTGRQIDLIEEVSKQELLKVLGSEKVEQFAVIKEGKSRAYRLFDTEIEADGYVDYLHDQGKGPYKVERRITQKVVFANMKDYGILSFQRNGEPVYFKTHDEDLYESLAEIDLQHFNNLFMRMFSGAKRLLSFGATFGPAFRVRNMIRDTVHTAVVSKSFMPFVDTARGFVKSMNEDQDYIEYMASGFGFGSSYVNADDPESGARFIKRIVRREGRGAVGRILTSPAKIFNVWEKIGSASENAARLGLYTNLKKKGQSNFDAGFEGRDLMDFSMRGSAQTVQVLTRIIPFLNARGQAMYKLTRAAKENPKAFLLKASILTGAALVLWGLYKDDERYKELEDWDKWTYFHFWVGDDHYRIPKPFEIGAFFCSLPESIANVQNDTEEGAFVWEWFLHTARDVFNIDMPQLMKPYMEVQFNLSTFKGRPVVPEHMKHLRASEQYQPWTSATMRMIGDQFNLSPMKLEHYVNGYLSTIGAMVLSGTDIVSREAMGYPSRPAGGRNPFQLGIKVDKARNTKHITRFYKLYEEVDGAYRTFRHYAKTGQTDRAKEFHKENREILSLRRPVNKIRSRLSEINRELKRVQRSRKLNPKEKKVRMEQLNSIKQNITRVLFQKIRNQK